MKIYYEQYGVGMTKYSVLFHDGAQTHADGSAFYGIRIFTNKRLKNRFVRELVKAGYELR